MRGDLLEILSEQAMLSDRRREFAGPSAEAKV